MVLEDFKMLSTKTDKNTQVIEESTYFHPEEYQSTADRKALLELLSF